MRLYVRTAVPEFQPIDALKARVWLRHGRLGEALAWAPERGLSAQERLSYLREYEHITLARVLIAQHKSDPQAGAIPGAIDWLQRLLQAAEAGQRMGSVIEILVTQARAIQAHGDVTQALVPMERALSMAEPEGYVRNFVDECAPMAKLLSESAERGILPGKTGRLIAAFQAEPQTGKGKPDLPNAQRLIEPLSLRELEVLELMAQGHSNREIGERLFLAVTTVKGYNQKLFDKLQVQRRTEAIARARALGLLWPRRSRSLKESFLE